MDWVARSQRRPSLLGLLSRLPSSLSLLCSVAFVVVITDEFSRSDDRVITCHVIPLLSQAQLLGGPVVAPRCVDDLQTTTLATCANAIDCRSYRCREWSQRSQEPPLRTEGHLVCLGFSPCDPQLIDECNCEQDSNSDFIGL